MLWRRGNAMIPSYTDAMQRPATLRPAPPAVVELAGVEKTYRSDPVRLMGLASALSMGFIERTREVGILCCVGGRARCSRRLFSAEAVVLATAGWAFGVLLGWLIYQGLLALLLHNADVTLP